MKIQHYFIKLSILIISIALLFTINTCNKESAEELCNLLTCDNENKPWIDNNCSPESSGTDYTKNILEKDRYGRTIRYTITTNNSKYEISDVIYDQYARPISYTFKITCNRGSKKYKGNISNVDYNGIGQAQSYDATINNTSCRYIR